MLVKLKEVEPYNNTGRDVNEVKGFFTGIPANSSFELNGTIKPKCMLMDNIVYKEHIGLNTAQGVLLSINLDTYFDGLDSGKSHNELLQLYGIGGIRIQYRTEESPRNLNIKTFAMKF